MLYFLIFNDFFKPVSSYRASAPKPKIANDSNDRRDRRVEIFVVSLLRYFELVAYISMIIAMSRSAFIKIVSGSINIPLALVLKIFFSTLIFLKFFKFKVFFLRVPYYIYYLYKVSLLRFILLALSFGFFHALSSQFCTLLSFCKYVGRRLRNKLILNFTLPLPNFFLFIKISAPKSSNTRSVILIKLIKRLLFLLLTALPLVLTLLPIITILAILFLVV